MLFSIQQPNGNMKCFCNNRPNGLGTAIGGCYDTSCSVVNSPIRDRCGGHAESSLYAKNGG